MSVSTPPEARKTEPRYPPPPWFFRFVAWVSFKGRRLPFFGWAVIMLVPTGLIDYYLLKSQIPLVAATILLAEATAYLAGTNIHMSEQTRSLNERIAQAFEELVQQGRSRAPAGPGEPPPRPPA